MDNHGRYSRAIQIQKGTGKYKHNRQYICSVLVFCWQQANLYILDVAPPPHPQWAPGGHLRRMGSKPTMRLNPLLSYLERQRQLAGALQEIS